MTHASRHSFLIVWTILILLWICVVDAAKGDATTESSISKRKNPARTTITIKTDTSADWHPDKYKETMPQFMETAASVTYTSKNPPPLPRKPGSSITPIDQHSYACMIPCANLRDHLYTSCRSSTTRTNGCSGR